MTEHELWKSMGTNHYIRMFFSNIKKTFLKKIKSKLRPTLIIFSFLYSFSMISILFLNLYYRENIDSDSILDLNEIGDFLSGAFSPLVFLWPIVGYISDHRESRFSRQWLINEKINEIKSKQPDFHFGKINFDITKIGEKEHCKFICNLENIGNSVTRFSLNIIYANGTVEDFKEKIVTCLKFENGKKNKY